MKPIVLHSVAASEIEDAAERYNGLQSGLGDEFEDKLEETLLLISHQPKAFSPYPGGYRKCYLGKRFSYSVFYREYDDHVWVAAVYHSSREPGAGRLERPDAGMTG